MILKFKKLSLDAVIPQYQTDGAAGFDLHSIERVLLSPEKGIIPVRTGLAVEIPSFVYINIFYLTAIQAYFELQVRPRSGLALKHSIIIANSPGTIDEDYRGEIKVLMGILHGNFVINPGDRIAQAIVSMVVRPSICEVNKLSETKRGIGGFGSTGIAG